MDPVATPPAPQARTPGIAITALVFGILGLFCLGPLGAIPAVICGHIGYRRIAKSGGTLTGSGLAMAGFITGYIGIALMVVMVPMYMAIALPSFVRAREVAQTNACVNNLRMIEIAKEQWVLDEGKPEGTEVTAAELVDYLGREMDQVQCPAGGEYSIMPVGVPPTCSIEGHSLDRY